jgi:hypothetical protein
MGITPEDRIVRKDRNSKLEFYLLPEAFEDWKLTHENHLGLTFTLRRKPYKYIRNTDNPHPNIERSAYMCHRGKRPDPHQNRIRGGVSGKSRKRGEVTYTGCPSELTVTLQEKVVDGKIRAVYYIEYNYRHNHAVGMKDKIGTQRKSSALNRRIENYVRQGRSIQNIIHILSVDQERFTTALEEGERVARDDVITYDDVYNVVYKINIKESRKHNDPIVSANMWMAELERKGYFTFYHPAGQYYGFSSPWQLEQLKSYGEVFCFDGTHEVFGYEQSVFFFIFF